MPLARGIGVGADEHTQVVNDVNCGLRAGRVGDGRNLAAANEVARNQNGVCVKTLPSHLRLVVDAGGDEVVCVGDGDVVQCAMCQRENLAKPGTIRVSAGKNALAMTDGVQLRTAVCRNAADRNVVGVGAAGVGETYRGIRIIRRHIVTDNLAGVADPITLRDGSVRIENWR